MTHSDRLPECVEFQCQVKETVMKHIEESIFIRDMVKDHDIRVRLIEKTHDKIAELEKIVLQGTFRIVVTILSFGIGLAVSWGILITKVGRLESLHPFGSQIETTGSQ